jgi:hypothetical protein
MCQVIEGYGCKGSRQKYGSQSARCRHFALMGREGKEVGMRVVILDHLPANIAFIVSGVWIKGKGGSKWTP